MDTRILAINSMDIQGKFGVSADLRTATLCHCYCSTIVTSFNSPKLDVLKSKPSIDPSFLKEQLTQIFDTQKIDAVKIGFLPSIEAMSLVHDFFVGRKLNVPIVLDPVFPVSAMNDEDQDFNAFIAAFRRYLVHIVDLMIPSIQEAEQILGTHIDSFDAAENAASMIQSLGTKTILLKGAQIPSPESMDFFASDEELHRLNFTKTTKKPNDLAISLSAAITTYLARGMNVYDAVISGKDLIQSSLKDDEDYHDDDI